MKTKTIKVNYKAISGDTTVYLDSATNLEEAKRDLNLLEEYENWSLMLYNPMKEERNDLNI